MTLIVNSLGSINTVHREVSHGAVFLDIPVQPQLLLLPTENVEDSHRSYAIGTKWIDENASFTHAVPSFDPPILDFSIIEANVKDYLLNTKIDGVPLIEKWIAMRDGSKGRNKPSPDLWIVGSTAIAGLGSENHERIFSHAKVEDLYTPYAAEVLNKAVNDLDTRAIPAVRSWDENILILIDFILSNKTFQERQLYYRKQWGELFHDFSQELGFLIIPTLGEHFLVREGTLDQVIGTPNKPFLAYSSNLRLEVDADSLTSSGANLKVRVVCENNEHPAKALVHKAYGFFDLDPEGHNYAASCVYCSSKIANKRIPAPKLEKLLEPLRLYWKSRRNRSDVFANLVRNIVGSHHRQAIDAATAGVLLQLETALPIESEAALEIWKLAFSQNDRKGDGLLATILRLRIDHQCSAEKINRLLTVYGLCHMAMPCANKDYDAVEATYTEQEGKPCVSLKLDEGVFLHLPLTVNETIQALDKEFTSPSALLALSDEVYHILQRWIGTTCDSDLYEGIGSSNIYKFQSKIPHEFEAIKNTLQGFFESENQILKMSAVILLMTYSELGSPEAQKMLFVHAIPAIFSKNSTIAEFILIKFLSASVAESQWALIEYMCMEGRLPSALAVTRKPEFCRMALQLQGSEISSSFFQLLLEQDAVAAVDYLLNISHEAGFIEQRDIFIDKCMQKLSKETLIAKFDTLVAIAPTRRDIIQFCLDDRKDLIPSILSKVKEGKVVIEALLLFECCLVANRTTSFDKTILIELIEQSRSAFGRLWSRCCSEILLPIAQEFLASEDIKFIEAGKTLKATLEKELTASSLTSLIDEDFKAHYRLVILETKLAQQQFSDLSSKFIKLMRSPLDMPSKERLEKCLRMYVQQGIPSDIKQEKLSHFFEAAVDGQYYWLAAELLKKALTVEQERDYIVQHHSLRGRYVKRFIKHWKASEQLLDQLNTAFDWMDKKARLALGDALWLSCMRQWLVFAESLDIDIETANVEHVFSELMHYFESPSLSLDHEEHRALALILPGLIKRSERASLAPIMTARAIASLCSALDLSHASHQVVMKQWIHIAQVNGIDVDQNLTALKVNFGLSADDEVNKSISKHFLENEALTSSRSFCLQAFHFLRKLGCSSQAMQYLEKISNVLKDTSEELSSSQALEIIECIDLTEGVVEEYVFNLLETLQNQSLTPTTRKYWEQCVGTKITAALKQNKYLLAGKLCLLLDNVEEYFDVVVKRLMTSNASFLACASQLIKKHPGKCSKECWKKLWSEATSKNASSAIEGLFSLFNQGVPYVKDDQIVEDIYNSALIVLVRQDSPLLVNFIKDNPDIKKIAFQSKANKQLRLYLTKAALEEAFSKENDDSSTATLWSLWKNLKEIDNTNSLLPEYAIKILKLSIERDDEAVSTRLIEYLEKKLEDKSSKVAQSCETLFALLSKWPNRFDSKLFHLIQSVHQTPFEQAKTYEAVLNWLLSTCEKNKEALEFSIVLLTKFQSLFKPSLDKYIHSKHREEWNHFFTNLSENTNYFIKVYPLFSNLPHGNEKEKENRLELLSILMGFQFGGLSSQTSLNIKEVKETLVIFENTAKELKLTKSFDAYLYSVLSLLIRLSYTGNEHKLFLHYAKFCIGMLKDKPVLLQFFIKELHDKFSKVVSRSSLEAYHEVMLDLMSLVVDSKLHLNQQLPIELTKELMVNLAFASGQKSVSNIQKLFPLIMGDEILGIALEIFIKKSIEIEDLAKKYTEEKLLEGFIELSRLIHRYERSSLSLLFTKFKVCCSKGKVFFNRYETQLRFYESLIGIFNSYDDLQHIAQHLNREEDVFGASVKDPVLKAKAIQLHLEYYKGLSNTQVLLQNDVKDKQVLYTISIFKRLLEKGFFDEDLPDISRIYSTFVSRTYDLIFFDLKYLTSTSEVEAKDEKFLASIYTLFVTPLLKKPHLRSVPRHTFESIVAGVKILAFYNKKLDVHNWLKGLFLSPTGIIKDLVSIYQYMSSEDTKRFAIQSYLEVFPVEKMGQEVTTLLKKPFTGENILLSAEITKIALALGHQLSESHTLQVREALLEACTMDFPAIEKKMIFLLIINLFNLDFFSNDEKIHRCLLNLFKEFSEEKDADIVSAAFRLIQAAKFWHLQSFILNEKLEWLYQYHGDAFGKEFAGSSYHETLKAFCISQCQQNQFDFLFWAPPLFFLQSGENASQLIEGILSYTLKAGKMDQTFLLLNIIRDSNFLLVEKKLEEILDMLFHNAYRGDEYVLNEYLDFYMFHPVYQKLFDKTTFSFQIISKLLSGMDGDDTPTGKKIIEYIGVKAFERIKLEIETNIKSKNISREYIAFINGWLITGRRWSNVAVEKEIYLLLWKNSPAALKQSLLIRMIAGSPYVELFHFESDERKEIAKAALEFLQDLVSKNKRNTPEIHLEELKAMFILLADGALLEVKQTKDLIEKFQKKLPLESFLVLAADLVQYPCFKAVLKCEKLLLEYLSGKQGPNQMLICLSLIHRFAIYDIGIWSHFIAWVNVWDKKPMEEYISFIEQIYKAEKFQKNDSLQAQFYLALLTQYNKHKMPLTLSLGISKERIALYSNELGSSRTEFIEKLVENRLYFPTISKEEWNLLFELRAPLALNKERDTSLVKKAYLSEDFSIMAKAVPLLEKHLKQKDNTLFINLFSLLINRAAKTPLPGSFVNACVEYLKTLSAQPLNGSLLNLVNLLIKTKNETLSLQAIQLLAKLIPVLKAENSKNLGKESPRVLEAIEAICELVQDTVSHIELIVPTLKLAKSAGLLSDENFDNALKNYIRSSLNLQLNTQDPCKFFEATWRASLALLTSNVAYNKNLPQIASAFIQPLIKYSLIASRENVNALFSQLEKKLNVEMRSQAVGYQSQDKIPPHYWSTNKGLALRLMLFYSILEYKEERDVFIKKLLSWSLHLLQELAIRYSFEANAISKAATTQLLAPQVINQDLLEWHYPEIMKVVNGNTFMPIWQIDQDGAETVGMISCILTARHDSIPTVTAEKFYDIVSVLLETKDRYRLEIACNFIQHLGSRVRLQDLNAVKEKIILPLANGCLWIENKMFVLPVLVKTVLEYLSAEDASNLDVIKVVIREKHSLEDILRLFEKFGCLYFKANQEEQFYGELKSLLSVVIASKNKDLMLRFLKCIVQKGKKPAQSTDLLQNLLESYCLQLMKVPQGKEVVRYILKKPLICGLFTHKQDLVARLISFVESQK